MAQTRIALQLARGFRLRFPVMRRIGAAFAALCALGVMLVAGGCAYRIDIQQGNIVDPDDLEQVREGMTRSQVQFLLGTPMIADPFHADRWDYTYYFKQGRRRDVTRYWITIHFEEDRVVRVEERIPIEGDPEREATAIDGDLGREAPEIDG